jgi:ribonuclease VapC
MVVDTSAVIAFLRGEAGADRIEILLDETSELRMSAFNAFECRVVLLRRFGESAVGDFDLLVVRAGVILDPFDADQAELALEGYRRFGKGSGHPAQLNLGDCAAYALARSRALPLLFVGDDFSRTDIQQFSF